MDENIVIRLAEPGTFVDELTDVLRNGARKLLTQAIEAEVADFLGRYSDLVTEKGRQQVVRHGQLPEREIMTGIGPVRCALSGFAIAPDKTNRASAFRRRSCRRTRAERGASRS